MEKRFINYENFALTENEIEDAIKQGILVSNFRELALKLDSATNRYVEKRMESFTAGYLQSFGIHLFYCKDNSSVYDSFYITDFFFICRKGRMDSYFQPETKFKQQYFFYNTPDTFVVIPLSTLKSCELVNAKSFSGTFNTSKTETVNKGTVKGAIVGGAIAGPAGAVVGAIANTKSTPVTTTTTHFYNEDVYDLMISFEKNGNTLSCNLEGYEKVDKRNENAAKISEERIKQNNAQCAALIESSKITLSEKEMSEKVKQTISQGTKQVAKDKAASIGCLTVIIIVIFIIVWLIGM